MAKKVKKEVKKAEELKYPLWLRYEEKCRTISDNYGEDGPYTGFSEEEKEFKPLYLKLTEPKEKLFHGVEKLEVDFDPKDCTKLYLVVVRYTDGGTFGTTHGYHVVKGIFKDDDSAYDFKKQIEDGKLPKSTYDFGGRTQECMHEWEGYFASLDSVEVHRLEVE
jgi:hypothetical protein